MANPNTRIYYATQAVALQPVSQSGTNGIGWIYPKGIQSVGMTTNFNLEQLFQLGQLELYDNVENVPDVEVTMQKTMDGTIPLYPLCVCGNAGVSNAKNKQIGQLATNRVDFALHIYKDTAVDAFVGNDLQNSSGEYTMTCSGMYLSSVSYTIPVEGFITEDITLVGNSKKWTTGGNAYGAGDTAGTQVLTAPGVGRRTNLAATSVLPSNVGVNANKKGAIPIPVGRTQPYLQNITVSMDLGREAIFELGKFAPYTRYVTFPLEVTSEFEIIAERDDQVNADDFNNAAACAGTSISNLDDLQIKLEICGSGALDKYTIDLGPKNKLTSVNYAGGDTGGGNATLTYSYQTFNYFKVDFFGSYASSGAVLTTVT